MKRFKTNTFLAAVLLALAAIPARAITINPNFGTTPNSGGFISDGGDDQFDFSDLEIGGAGYTVGLAGAIPNFTVGLQTVNGIDVTGRLDLLVPNGSTTANTLAGAGVADFVYARHFYSFTNPGGAAVSPTIRFDYDFGSDFDTIVHSTSSGDTTITAADIWAVTDDGDDGGPATPSASADPALGFLVADGAGLFPSNFDPPSTGQLDVDYILPLNAGETRSLMLFIASRNELPFRCTDGCPTPVVIGTTPTIGPLHLCPTAVKSSYTLVMRSPHPVLSSRIVSHGPEHYI